MSIAALPLFANCRKPRRALNERGAAYVSLLIIDISRQTPNVIHISTTQSSVCISKRQAKHATWSEEISKIDWPWSSHKSNDRNVPLSTILDVATSQRPDVNTVDNGHSSHELGRFFD